jgi:Domain of unknown function (DUF1918)
MLYALEARGIGTEEQAGVGDESKSRRLVGDKGRTTVRSDKRGLIREVHSADGSPPNVVRWLATDHLATVVPGNDAIVVPSEE